MKAFTKFLASGAGLAALATAAPAAAQYYPPYGGGYGQGGVVGTILDSILGGRSYAQNDRFAIDMCVRATEARLNGYNGGYGNYGGYGAYGGQYGSYGGYGGYNQYGGARVVRITQVERRSNGGLKVHGIADNANNNYGAYGSPYGGAYGNPYGGYGGYGYNSANSADYRFNCKVDYRGRVTDVDIDRLRRY